MRSQQQWSFRLDAHDPASEGQVPSPGGWRPPPGARPGWNWIPRSGASQRLEGIPFWLRLWIRVPVVDRFAFPRLWDRGGYWVHPPE